MKVVLDGGAALIVFVLVYAIASLFIALPTIQVHWIVAELVAAPIMLFFLLHEWWDMIRRHRWFWLIASLVAAPINVIAYYFVVHRKELPSV